MGMNVMGMQLQPTGMGWGWFVCLLAWRLTALSAQIGYTVP